MRGVRDDFSVSYVITVVFAYSESVPFDHSHPDSYKYALFDWDSHATPHAQSDPVVVADSNADPYAVANTVRDGFSDSNPNTFTESDSNSFEDSDAVKVSKSDVLTLWHCLGVAFTVWIPVRHSVIERLAHAIGDRDKESVTKCDAVPNPVPFAVPNADSNAFSDGVPDAVAVGDAERDAISYSKPDKQRLRDIDWHAVTESHAEFDPEQVTLADREPAGVT